MVAVVKTFNYTGTLQQTTIPAGTTSIDVYLWGGAGGGGGSDAGGPGGRGAAGHYLEHTGFAISSAQIGQTLEVAVGGSGGGGSAGQGAPGGDNGKSITGYSGGDGGASGNSRPTSGSGGGGGGATVLLINSVAQHIAGGGAGGGGAGQYSDGTAGINTTSATSNSPSTLGENGADHTGDGGGGGAGGGGFNGGKGGSGGSGDNGGTGGYSGLNLAQTGFTTSSVGSGVTPGGTGSPYYSSGIAIGGNPSSPGADGKAVVVFNIGVQANYKVSGTWKSINAMYQKVSGSWKRITAGYYKVGGVWKALFNSGVEFIETAAGFGDSTGGSTSGTPGSGGGGCFIAGTMITMHDGSLKPVEQVDIGDTVSVGGKVFATGKFLIDNLYDYNGIQVSGTHMVKEDGAWTRVEDSRLGVSLGDDEAIVYVFGNENRRIMINNTEFTDYFELSEQQELVNHGEQFFSNWQDHDRQIHDKNVNILNAS
jgi:hypothetical protein